MINPIINAINRYILFISIACLTVIVLPTSKVYASEISVCTAILKAAKNARRDTPIDPQFTVKLNGKLYNGTTFLSKMRYINFRIDVEGKNIKALAARTACHKALKEAKK